MYKMYDEMHVEVKHHLRGGEGDPVTRQIFSPEELGGRAEMFNIMTLQPGESVGVHDHVTNGEAYWSCPAASRSRTTRQAAS